MSRFSKPLYRVSWPGGDLGHPKKYHDGSATSRGWTCTIDGNPVGFCLIVCFRAVIVGVAIAEIMYGSDDVMIPSKHQHALPFLQRGHHSLMFPRAAWGLRPYQHFIGTHGWFWPTAA